MTGKKVAIWLPFSLNIVLVCLRSLHKINILHIEQIIILVRPGYCMIACEYVFNLHAWPTERPPLEREECKSLSVEVWVPLKCTSCDGYQTQLSQHHSPTFTKDFPVALSCMSFSTSFKVTFTTDYTLDQAHNTCIRRNLTHLKHEHKRCKYKKTSSRSF